MQFRFLLSSKRLFIRRWQWLSWDCRALCKIITAFVWQHRRVCSKWGMRVPRPPKICQQVKMFPIHGSSSSCFYAPWTLNSWDATKKTNPSVLIQHAWTSLKAFETLCAIHTAYPEENSKSLLYMIILIQANMTTETNSTQRYHFKSPFHHDMAEFSNHKAFLFTYIINILVWRTCQV